MTVLVARPAEPAGGRGACAGNARGGTPVAPAMNARLRLSQVSAGLDRGERPGVTATAWRPFSLKAAGQG